MVSNARVQRKARNSDARYPSVGSVRPVTCAELLLGCCDGIKNLNHTLVTKELGMNDGKLIGRKLFQGVRENHILNSQAPSTTDVNDRNIYIQKM